MPEEITVDLVYCEGFDPEARTLVGRIGVEEARRRHAAGEQFAVAAVTADGGRVPALVDWAGTQRYARVWRFDEQGRRVHQTQCRLVPEGGLFVTEVRLWTYDSAGQAEFDRGAGQETIRNFRSGRVEHEAAPAGEGGGMRATQTQVDPATLVVPVPSFGDLSTLFGLGPVRVRRVDDAIDPATAPPWRPPVPLPPGDPTALFEPGVRYSLAGSGSTVITDVRPAGVARLVSGQLAAADPGWLDGVDPFTTPVAPGAYRVDLAVIRFIDQPDHTRVAAARLTVVDAPVASWEPALTASAEPLMLGEGEFQGFGVDSGMACFFDVAAGPALAELSDQAVADWDGMADLPAELVDPATGASLVQFTSGWGDGAYPTWLGRTAEGEVACFVVDLLVLREAEIVPSA
ncbi:DUF4241 domain-containing protein [Actinokineospora xionganensis]|uniref:DUF4241 domain-containing protein n=1 Tax=Actinokineospora xionganensis TaxID=2684470 RepID=A0ABR7LFJ3_9PSEU|nr:DUF4241 domain-containing protein [Actinokineospora xionganensis]MBC6451434.1 DUF4241 domain-containing protein [Actinokineospora xionganensis]